MPICCQLLHRRSIRTFAEDESLCFHSFIYVFVSPPQMVVATGGKSAESTGGQSCPGSLESTPQIPMLLRVPYMDYRNGCVGRGVQGLSILLHTKALRIHILSGYMVGNGGLSGRSPW